MSMLIVEEYLEADPGHALLRLQGASAGEDARFRLLRPGAELPYLGPGGWQSEPALLTPLSVRHDDGEVVLVVGPAVVDQIGLDTRVRVEAEGLGFTGEAYWPDMAPSLGGPATAYVDASRPAVAPATAPPPRPKPKSSPPAAATVEPTPRPDATAAPEPPPSPAASPTAGDDGPSRPGAGPGPAAAGKKSSALPLVLGGLVLLLLAAGSGLYALDPLGWFEEDEPRTAVPAPPAETEPVAPIAACGEADFAALLADDANLEAWQQVAAACRGQAEPAAYVAALDSCVAEGRAACLFQMARCYDPRHADDIRCAPGGEPDMAIAIDYYSRAEAADLAAAAPERAALCEQLEADDAEAAFLAGCE